MHKNGEQYEYIAVYIDDLSFALKDPQSFTDTLKNDYQFKIKEAGPLEFHLGADFFRDDEGTLCMAPQKYIERVVASYEKMFGKSQVPKCTPHWKKGITLNWMTPNCLMFKAYNNTSPLLDHCSGPF